MFLKIRMDCPGDQSKWYRHISKGGWTHSTADEAWPVSDCTAEALKVVLVHDVCIHPKLLCNTILVHLSIYLSFGSLKLLELKDIKLSCLPCMHVNILAQIRSMHSPCRRRGHVSFQFYRPVARLASAQPAHPGSNPHLAVILQGGANFKPGYNPSVYPQGESHPT
jgi:hypothetical protein